ncbi:hypothetical protein IHQ68_04845 [Chelatococcus sambhunathii]|uniref:Uncharacterized protein n=1 Tax=Chelatococcus sambhunathii TaxID=363953 RepID=A0ABU1DCV8_9HYPH|nr:hypothetical protein [Chelatococcus sambhunathii]MDR4305952.1 hypothetical protein [Chelatococcus sambhunathii]
MSRTDSLIVITSLAIAVAAIARRRLLSPDILRAALVPGEVPNVRALIDALHEVGENERAIGLVEQLVQLASLGGWKAAIAAAPAHAVESWDAAVAMARGE